MVANSPFGQSTAEQRVAIESMQTTATWLRNALVAGTNEESNISHLLPEAMRPVSIELDKSGVGTEREEIKFTFKDNAGATAFHTMLQGLCAAKSGNCEMHSKCNALKATQVMAGVPRGNSITTGDKEILQRLSDAVEALQSLKDHPHAGLAAAVLSGAGAGIEKTASRTR